MGKVYSGIWRRRHPSDLNPVPADGDVSRQFGVYFQSEAEEPLSGVDAAEESALDVADDDDESGQQQRDGGVAVRPSVLPSVSRIRCRNEPERVSQQILQRAGGIETNEEEPAGQHTDAADVTASRVQLLLQLIDHLLNSDGPGRCQLLDVETDRVRIYGV